MVNEEVRKLWEKQINHDPQAKRKLAAIDGKIANIRRSIEDGLTDTKWANGRIRELTSQRECMANVVETVGEPLRVDVDTVMAYRRDLKRLLAKGTPQERKQLIRTWVHEMTLDPKKLHVEIKYGVPEGMLMYKRLAGVGFEPTTSGL